MGDFASAVASIEALPISDAQKVAIIAQMAVLLAAPSQHVDPVAATAAAPTSQVAAQAAQAAPAPTPALPADLRDPQTGLFPSLNVMPANYGSIAGQKVQVDCLLPSGTPDTVTLVPTGHTLSLPHPEKGEMLIGYCQRVAVQAGGMPQQAGGLIVMQGVGPSHTGDPMLDYPIIVDAYFNRVPWMTPTERAEYVLAQQAAITAANKQVAFGSVAPGTTTYADNVYMAEVAKQVMSKQLGQAGTTGGNVLYDLVANVIYGKNVDVASIINSALAGDPLPLNYDLASYTGPLKATIDAAAAKVVAQRIAAAKNPPTTGGGGGGHKVLQ